MITRKSSGFTMIELLTVIAIIAILAAIIFPIMSSAKESARRTQCISNMEQIFQAVQLFKADEHRYPDFIAGPVRWKADGTAYGLSDSLGVTTNGTLVSLYPEYIKSINDLKCPHSKASTSDIVADPMYALLNAMDWTDRTKPMRAIGETVTSGVQPYYLYKASSYDLQLPKGAASDEVHYTTAWSNEDSVSIEVAYSGDEREQQLARISRQMRWKQPPSDTIITWCSLHRDAASNGEPNNGSKDIVLFLDGSAKFMPSKPVYQAGWGNVWDVITPTTGR